MEPSRAIVEDPAIWEELAGDARLPIARAYLACTEQDVLTNFVLLATLRAPEQIGCVRHALGGPVPAEAVAASLAFGHGFDDLAPELVDTLTAAAVSCLPDPQWWLDDEAFLLEQNGATPDDVRCVAAAYVENLGVEAIARRRILTLDFVPATPPQLERLDLPTRCGVRMPMAVVDLGVRPGDCVTGFGQGARATIVVDCAQDHNGEIVSLKDLAAVFPGWPGAKDLGAAAERQCLADIAAVVDDRTGYAAGWDFPDRASWEASARALTCVLIKSDLSSWTGPSGLVPMAATTTSTTSPTTAAPTGTTLPPGAREMFSLDEIDRVGMCVYRAPALPGAGRPRPPLLRSRLPAAAPGRDVPPVHDRSRAWRPYPGDATVQGQANPVCELTFAAYVGVPWESSRLDYVYFYPSAETWNIGDRAVVCFLVGTQVDEVFTRSMADSRE